MTKKLIRAFNAGELSLLCQVITGHGPFRGHVGNWMEDVDPRCSLCGEDVELPAHLWYSCPALELERKQMEGREDSLRSQLRTFFKETKVARLMHSVLDLIKKSN